VSARRRSGRSSSLPASLYAGMLKATPPGATRGDPKSKSRPNPSHRFFDRSRRWYGLRGLDAAGLGLEQGEAELEALPLRAPGCGEAQALLGLKPAEPSVRRCV
jgi:hypothetical protein